MTSSSRKTQRNLYKVKHVSAVFVPSGLDHNVVSGLMGKVAGSIHVSANRYLALGDICYSLMFHAQDIKPAKAM